MPTPGPDWDHAAVAARRGDLRAAAAASCRAYGLDPGPLVEWWASRLPYRDDRD
jgi:hypothetical protein